MPNVTPRVITTGHAIARLVDELERARALHPGNALLFEALGEEVGELARALGGGDGDVITEAVQVACVAIRIASEGTTGPRHDVMVLATHLEEVSRRILGEDAGGAA
jgi:hypothetical protein